jgi:hypothetical protein
MTPGSKYLLAPTSLLVITNKRFHKMGERLKENKGKGAM